nr:MAG TPA: hypothetical protein [Inoviridae sp.]
MMIVKMSLVLVLFLATLFILMSMLYLLFILLKMALIITHSIKVKFPAMLALILLKALFIPVIRLFILLNLVLREVILIPLPSNVRYV